MVGLTGLAVAGAAGRSADADRSHALVGLGGSAARLAGVLQRERVSAALVFAEPGQSSTAAYTRDAAATDAAVAQFRTERGQTDVPAGLAPLMTRLDGELAGLDALRQQVTTAPDAVLSVVAFSYRAVIADLVAYRQGLGQVGVSAATANGLRAAAALSQAIESLGQVQVAAVRAVDAGRLTPAGQQEIVAANTGLTEALQTFGGLGEPRWQGLVNGRLSAGAEVLRSERLLGVVTRAQPGQRLTLGTSARGFAAAMQVRADALHAAEGEIDRELLAAVAAERDAQRRAAVTTLTVVAGLLLVVVAAGWWVTRSLSGSLRRLQVGARLVAEQRLPQMVDRVSVESIDEAAVAKLVTEAAAPIPVDGTDEIGQVAAAFNQVGASAVRLAAEQARLRAVIGAMFLSLSRRLQKRSDRMMASLDGLERGEEDPEQLQKLFELDHTATLLRRLIANLQVLAGGQAGRPREALVALPTVLQAAGQGIDAYTQVHQIGVDDSVHIRGHVVEDLAHLLTELLDNAAQAAPPDRQVLVEARRVGDLLHIQVQDEGAGMTPETLAAVRERLAQPRLLDLQATQKMGLPVVGTIAQRLGIQVEVRSALREGTRVDLTVPAELFEHRPPMPEITAPPPPRAVPAAVGQPSTRPAALPAAPLPDGPRAGPADGTPTVPPWIFLQMSGSFATDPTASWFETTGAGDRPPAGGGELVGAGVTQSAWDAPTRAVAPVQRTASGLPVRRPGAMAYAPLPQPAAGGAVPARRDPELMRARMAAMQGGLVRAQRTYHVMRSDQG
ncbi:sensor histidine kinase [Phytohabitans kaempferiae]|uniref:histidine kinase n=1 Tax=Phytohabitans kaempferiae TaxID=1620943 RepID=A0ABV6MBH5_9ACTN